MGTFRNERINMTPEQKLRRNAYMSKYYKRKENRAKKNEMNREYRKKNLEKVRGWEKKYSKQNPNVHRAWQLLRKFGMTIDEYDKLFEVQKGVCAICFGLEPVPGKRLAVDHNHRTNEIRGLLCSSCNRKLGWYEVLKESIHKYLG